jgi:hypothetical protein
MAELQLVDAGPDLFASSEAVARLEDLAAYCAAESFGFVACLMSAVSDADSTVGRTASLRGSVFEMFEVV